VDDIKKLYSINEDALPLYFFFAPIDEGKKREIYCERLYTTAQHSDRMIKRAQDFRRGHNIGVGNLRTSSAGIDTKPPPVVIELGDTDDEDSADEGSGKAAEPAAVEKQDTDAITKEIVEEIQNHTLTTRLDQRISHIFYLLAASLFMFDPEECYRDNFELKLHGFYKSLRL